MQKDIEQLIASGNIRSAIPRLDALLETDSDISWAWRKKAQCHFMLGQMPAAVEAARTAVRSARELSDRLAEAEAENALGIIHGELGDLQQSLQHLERSYELHQELETHKVATVLNNIGNTCLIMKDAKRALEYFEKALIEANRNEDLREVQGTARSNLGRACLALNRIPEAVNHLKLSITHFSDFGMEPLRIHAITKLAAVYEADHDSEAAERCYQEALAATVGEEEPTAWQYEIHGSLAALLVKEGRYEEAEPHFLKAFRLVSEQQANFNIPYWRRDYSSVLEMDGEITAALSQMRQAFSELDRTTEKKIEKELYQAMGRFELERIEHEKEVYRLRNEELAAALREVEQLRDSLQKRNHELSELVIRDPLTAVFNRRWFFSQLDVEIDRGRRHDRPVSIALIDLDHFKAVNDTLGHAVGDQVLVTASNILMRSTRKTDNIARYGGEEFAIIMPDSDATQALVVCEKLRTLFETCDWTSCGDLKNLTFSAGIACIRETSAQDNSTGKEMIELADTRLYEAKALGRNRIAGP